MKKDGLIPGTILVILGAIFLLDNFGVINFDWTNIFHLWPIILVMAGVNIMFAHNRTAGATLVKLLVVFIGMGFLLFGGFRNGRTRHTWFHNYSNDNTWNDESDSSNGDSIVKVEGSGRYTEPYKPEVKTAKLIVSGGATSYTLTNTTDQLFDAETKEYGNRYRLATSMNGSEEEINFSMNDSKRHHFNWTFGKNRSNHADIMLNTTPIWDITVEAGAAKLNFDLSKYKVNLIKLEGGAASFNVKMGQPLATTNVDISTGVASVDLSIPQNAACHISTDTGLSSKTFDGFDKKSDTEYETAGFANASNKMYIRMSGGVSSFRVSRY
jgi:hypothetical protein